MFRKLIASALLVSMSLSLMGCSGMFEKEYVHISEYTVSDQSSISSDGKVVVRNFNALKQAILDIVYSESGRGLISFDSTYDGDAVEDMASACWQVRTQDAMCAYCVENIAYEMNKIVSYYEAEISVTYSNVLAGVGGISRMQYATGLDEKLNTAISEGRRKLVLLINRSSYTAEGMGSLIEELYRENPAVAPSMPKVEVNMFSGNGMQKLYEINLGYEINNAELRSRRDAVNAVRPFENMQLEDMSQMDKALLACRYLVDNCSYGSETAGNSIYSALVLKDADSEGLAYAYVELCRQLGLNCRMIYGQYNWQEHWWNIVEVDGNYYHVDISSCMEGDLKPGFLLNDQTIWGTHRWNVSAYPACTGELIYGITEEELPQETEENEES